MANRSVNRVILLGNLTKDPELSYTNNGSAMCKITVATNRSWKTESGELKEDSQFHHVVSWNKLAELFSQLLKKGSKVYIDGRLENRKFQKDGVDFVVTEVNAEDMVVLTNKENQA